MTMDVIYLVIGLAMIIKGGDWFVAASVRIAELLNMPRVVIGSTLVSLTTTSPEFVVSIISGLEKEPGLAVGNAVGSCICNIGLILGVVAAIRHIQIHPGVLRTPMLAMMFCGILVFVLSMDLVLSHMQGWILIGLGSFYFLYDFLHHKRQAKPTEVRQAKMVKEEVTDTIAWVETGMGASLMFLLGAGIVIVGSKIMVGSAVSIADALGIPSIIIGLSVVAVGTSLPEFVTAVTSARKNVSDLAIGNVLGANVANLTLVVGSAAAINPVSMERLTQVFNFPAMLLLMAMLLYCIRVLKGISRKAGMTMLAFYILYIAALVVIAVTQRGAATVSP